MCIFCYLQLLMSRASRTVSSDGCARLNLLQLPGHELMCATPPLDSFFFLHCKHLSLEYVLEKFLIHSARYTFIMVTADCEFRLQLQPEGQNFTVDLFFFFLVCHVGNQLISRFLTLPKIYRAILSFFFGMTLSWSADALLCLFSSKLLPSASSRRQYVPFPFSTTSHPPVFDWHPTRDGPSRCVPLLRLNPRQATP